MTGLVDKSFIADVLTHEAPHAESHGAEGGFLGGGLIYYSLVYAHRCQRCLCIGSGGGFVPRMMKQAQRDLGFGETHLVDANMRKVQWGTPEWLSPDSFFRSNFPDIKLHIMTSRNAACAPFARLPFDYVHVDGDHSAEGCREDVMTYAGMLSPVGFMTIHDTRYHLENERCGVHVVIDELRDSPSFDVVELPHLGTGLAIVRLRDTQKSSDTEVEGVGVD